MRTLCYIILVRKLWFWFLRKEVDRVKREDREKQIERRIKIVALILGGVGALLSGLADLIQSLK